MASPKVPKPKTDLRYRDPSFVFSKMKEIESQLDLNWDLYATCNLKQLEVEMDLVKTQVIKITNDEHLAGLISKLILFGLLRQRVKENV